jgi:hypothetical protein
VSDFLADQSSAELSEWIEYERFRNEVQHNRLVHAIAHALSIVFQASKTQKTANDEEVIDTTQPGFKDQFKGFTRRPPQRGTEIRRG